MINIEIAVTESAVNLNCNCIFNTDKIYYYNIGQIYL